MIDLCQMHGFAHFFGQGINVWARNGCKRGLLPGGMGQTHQPQTGRIGLAIGIIGQHALLVEGLNETVKRGLRKTGLIKQFGKPNRPPKGRNLIQHLKCLADGSVVLGHLPFPPFGVAVQRHNQC